MTSWENLFNTGFRQSDILGFASVTGRSVKMADNKL
ncbi:predicted protein [Botrytis cinerea T4]|uniref:Uncharacterized protein n=1 Tax=Botryotinia fuckeliana (strain T4) TaxID=999810 RepID=G2YKZ8_BOTF4|nr:predicted protein [Botrytis cinerea T4]